MSGTSFKTSTGGVSKNATDNVQHAECFSFHSPHALLSSEMLPGILSTYYVYIYIHIYIYICTHIHMSFQPKVADGATCN